MSLRDHIEQEVRDRGPMPFSRYMEICLYDPAEGYYSRNSEQFGKAGDFYTCSDVHAVFGRLLSRQFEEMWQALDRPPRLEILELGPGRGLFARDVLDCSRKKYSDFFASLTFTLQESSPALRAKLAENLREHISSGKAALSAETIGIEVPEERPTLAPRISAETIQTRDQIPERRSRRNEGEGSRRAEISRSCSSEVPLVVFANEFFDALPVEILSSHGKLHLAFENSRLTEVWLPPTAEELEFLDRFGVHPESGERVEIALAAQRWIIQIANAIRRGFLLAFDYGYTRSEQLAGRHRGTLMAYRQHSASTNPYQAPGEQDLTAHVNFTALPAAAEQAGMTPHKLVTQSQFLMGIGQQTQFAEAFEDCRLPQERAKVALQLKHLVSPTGMGESFHVFLASRAVDPDKVAALSGLRFGSG